MNVDARLQLTMSQRLVMTPMLQQAIKLLQMSRLELVDMVKQELLENPVLDEVEDLSQYQEQSASEESSASDERAAADAHDASSSELEVIGLEKEHNQTESSIDWEEYFADNPAGLGYQGERDSGEPTQNYEAMLSPSQSLADHLTWQLHMSRLPDRMFNIGTFLIGQIDDDGYIHYEASDAPDSRKQATLLASAAEADAHRAHVLEVLHRKLNLEFERQYVLSLLDDQENSDDLFALLLSQDYYEDFVQHRHERLFERLQYLTFGQIETIGNLITSIPPADLEAHTGIPAAEIEAALHTVCRICRDVRDLVEQHCASLLNDQYDTKLEKLELAVEELYLVEYLLLHVSAEEITYAANREYTKKGQKREADVRDFLERLRQSYAHVDQLQSHKYFLIQLYRIGQRVLLEHLQIDCPPRYRRLCLKLSTISPAMLTDAEARMRECLREYHRQHEPVTLEEVTHVLRHVQTFTPSGVGARDLQECLLIQARNLTVLDPLLEAVVQHHLRDIQQRRYANIAEKLDVTVEDVELVADILSNMSPRPGGDFSTQQPEYIVPDIYVHKVGDSYEVVLNDDDLPYLRINPMYKKLVLQSARGVESDAKQYVEQKLRSAMWFIRSVEQRKRTIYKVGQSLVKFQRDFLEYGVTHLKPLVLRDVADDISMHESTVSRVTTNKYIHTPQGVFELKYFFHSGLESSSGNDISSLAVKERIRQLIAEENSARPLSDNALEKILKQDGIAIARRTVAKYREELNIPSSLQRKRAR